MSQLLIGTDSGLFRLENDGSVIREEGPPTVAFLTRGQASVYAITREGALWERTDNSGWQLVHERPIPDEVWSFGADPRLLGRLYLGVSPALLYVSDDGGKTWTACPSIRRIPGYERWTFPPPPHIPHVRSIASDPKTAGAVYIGVEEGGVYRSADRGETWESLNEGLYWDVHTITPAPDGTRLYATTGDGFHRSDDGGRHWQHIMTGLDRRYTVPFLVSLKRPERLFTAAALGPPPSWYKGVNAAIYRSDDAGDHWERLGRGLPEQFDMMVRNLATDAAGDLYAATESELYGSPDEGENWELLAKDLPRVRALAAA